MPDPDPQPLPRGVLDALVDHAPVMMTVIDEAGRVVWANRECGRVLGRPAAELAGTPFLDRCADDPAERERAGRLLSAAAGTWEPIALRREDGTRVETMWRAVRLPGGVLTAIGRDVSDERALTARLSRAERLEAIGRLAGGIAHDFNNLLTVIGGNAQLLVELRELSGPAFEEAEEIVRAADTARSVVRQLLTFTGRAPQPLQSVDVNERIDHLRHLVHRLIDAHVGIVFDLAAGLPPVRLEEGQVEQVVINLLLNARDAMPRGGRVEVRTALAEIGAGGRAVAGARLPSGRYVTLVVSDSGQGMEAATLRRILEPFFTTKETTGGTGLGLATVHAIVQQAGGGLEVESVFGQGSTFTIYLPAAEPAPEPADEEDGAAPAVESAVILVVDDHEAVRALCRRALENDGHEVLEAVDAATALVAADRAPRLDLAVVDLRLRGQGGRDLTRELEARRPGVRTLLMSARPAPLGYDGPFLQKPFTPALLVGAVRRVLRRGAG